MKNIPNFLLISGGRSGSTSLYYYLSEHPEIFMPSNKEPYFLTGLDFNNFVYTPSFFIKDLWVRDLKSYKKLFDNVSNEKMIGEASVSYLYYYKETIPNIKKYLGDPKIIIIIRNPAERAYSHYLHNVQANLERLEFEEAISEEKKRISHNWWWGFHYKNAGFYLRPIVAYKEHFSNVKLFLFDDFRDNFLNTFKEILLFLQVDVDFVPNDLKHYNSSYFYKFGFNQILYNSSLSYISSRLNLKMPKFLKSILKKEAPTPPQSMLNRLKNEYKNEIKELEILFNTNLENWYEIDNFRERKTNARKGTI